MPDRKTKAERRAQHTKEVEQSQAAMRLSISETQRLVDESDAMLRRHRREIEDDERAEEADGADRADKD